MIEVIKHVKVPQALVNLITSEYEGLYSVDTVILVGGTDQLDGALGVFVPDTKSVIIDLRACIMNKQWMNKGMAFVPNALCNIIHTIFHEAIHAEQYEVLGEDMYQVSKTDLDNDADIRALEKSIDWFSANNRTPTLDELGWVGEQIKTLFNGIYAKASKFVDVELSLLGSKAGGLAQGMSMMPDYQEPQTLTEMLHAVQTGDIGLRVAGNMCLTTGDFLEVIANRNRS